MAKKIRLLPKASSFLASVRSMGYTLETAIADIIDNSITAMASQIDIICTVSSGQPLLCVIDNGKGMSEKEILEALIIGGADPRDVRDKNDLGRFGLGLKTASFSQCSQLTVVSKQKKQNKLSAASWDFDLIDKEKDYIASILDEDEIANLKFIDQIASSGTLVQWQKIDYLFDGVAVEDKENFINGKLSQLGDHLSLVFHRFLNGEIKSSPNLEIKINGHPLRAFDPFCLSNKATQILPFEKVRIGKSVVTIQPYILPHYSKLNKENSELYKNRSDFVSNQGAYVYRNGRLISWGDWFRLIPRGEATKLARVKIDFTNEIDRLWALDIKKASARPPQAVRERLKQVIARVSDSSSRVSKGHGKKLFQKDKAPIWNIHPKGGLNKYTINEKHPIIFNLSKNLNAVQKKHLDITLDAISASVPFEMIYSDFSTDPESLVFSINDESNTLKEKLELIYEMSKSEAAYSKKEFLSIVQSTRLFNQHTKLVDDFINSKFGGK